MVNRPRRARLRIARLLRRRPWLAFGGIYAAYGATFGVVGGGAPLVLRAHGVSLDNIGLLQIVNLPIGIAFLWAPFVDRWRLPGLPRRIGWIGGGMMVTCTCLALLGVAIARGSVVLAIVCAMLVTAAMATADIALEALIVETVRADDRAFVTTTKLAGSSLGTMIGVALATATPEAVGLADAMVVVATGNLALLTPLVFYPEGDAPSTQGRPARERGRRALLLRRAGVLGLFFAPAICLVSVPQLVLLDLRVPLPLVGAFTGALSTAINIAMTFVGGLAMRRIATPPLVAGLACGVAACALALGLSVAIVAPALGFAAAVLMVAFEGALGVPVFATLYRWAQGERPASDYALLFGTAFLVSFPARILAPIVAGVLGWPAFFLASVGLYALAVAALVAALGRTA